MSIIVIHFFTSICTSYRQKEKMLLLQKSYDEVEERLLVQKQNADKLRKIRHDIRKHICAMRRQSMKKDIRSRLLFLIA